MRERVERLLGMDFAAFCRSVLLAQNRFADFLKATPRERNEVLKGVFGYERFDGALEAAKRRVTAAQLLLESLDREGSQLASAREQLDVAERRLVARDGESHRARGGPGAVRTSRGGGRRGGAASARGGGRRRAAHADRIVAAGRRRDRRGRRRGGGVRDGRRAGGGGRGARRSRPRRCRGGPCGRGGARRRPGRLRVARDRARTPRGRGRARHEGARAGRRRGSRGRGGRRAARCRARTGDRRPRRGRALARRRERDGRRRRADPARCPSRRHGPHRCAPSSWPGSRVPSANRLWRRSRRPDERRRSQAPSRRSNAHVATSRRHGTRTGRQPTTATAADARLGPARDRADERALGLERADEAVRAADAALAAAQSELVDRLGEGDPRALLEERTRELAEASAAMERHERRGCRREGGPGSRPASR